MLSIGAMKGGQASYYLRLAQKDYYLAGGEPPGRWFGKGADQLGLAGVVAEGGLLNAFQGFGPDGNKLVQNAGKENRQPGWDLTFSAPKSVSVLWSQAKDAVRAAIQEANSAAVESTLRYIEAELAKSRLGKGGAELKDVGLAIATFEHSCSRALDPQLHTHCLVMNLGVDEDGKARAILSKPLYRAKMLAGAYYRCELAHQLRTRLGVDLERPLDSKARLESWFEVTGVPKGLLAHFSKRRNAIEEELGSRGLESATAAAFAALSTRDAKELIPPRHELQARWKNEAHELGLEIPELRKEVSALSEAKQTKLIERALADAVEAVTAGENAFSTELAARLTLENLQPHGLSSSFVVEKVKKQLQTSPAFVQLGVREGEELWTTQSVLSLEHEFLEAVKALKGRSFNAVSEATVSKILAKPRPASSPGGERFMLNAEQQDAVRYIARGKQSVKVVTGFAGTGKTDMLAAAREALEAGGYSVIGTALAGVAARTLQEKAGIASETLRLREIQLKQSLGVMIKHDIRQLFRAARKKKTWKLEPLTIGPKTVLIVDEAGMVGTRDFTLLAKAVVEGGGSVVAVGDQWQLSSIDRGGCFAQLAVEVDGVHLSEIRRQKDVADREAVKNLVAGDAESALKHYAEKGQLTVASERGTLEARLIRDWAANGGVTAPGDHRIFVGTRADANRYNQLAQWKRFESGALDARQRVEHGGENYFAGDRVRFNISSSALGVRKGESGAVIACKEGLFGKYVAVAVDGRGSTFSARTAEALKHHAIQLLKAALGKRTDKLPPRSDVVLIPLKTLNPRQKAYAGLTLDYAMTTHLGQGQTVKNAYIHLGGAMTSRELAYVQGSRHKEAMFLYCDERAAGAEIAKIAWIHSLDVAAPMPPADLPNYSSLVAQMNLSRAKELAAATQHELRHSANA